MADAAAAAAPVVMNDMNAYLEQTLGIGVQGIRQKIIGAGFTNLDVLVKKDDKFAHYACQTIRKSSTGPAQHRDVTMAVEEHLKQLVKYSKLRYMIQRPMDYPSATLDNLELVEDWFNQMEEDPSEEQVKDFTDGGNKRYWFESIVAHLSVKKGKSGFPLSYVIRENSELPAEDPGFGLPSLSDEVESRGRHDGYFWRADRRSVWLFLRAKCHGTTSWNTIKRFEGTTDGRGAYLALLGQFMGEDVKQHLLSTAERTLASLRFDNRNRNWTFDKFIGKLRGAFIDLGNTVTMTEQWKVYKLMQAWQVSGLMHLNAIVTSTPRYSDSFDNTVNFLATQLTALKLMNGPLNRNISAGHTTTTTRTPKGPRKGKGKDKDKTPAYKQKAAAKFQSKDPKAYVSSEAWKKMTDEEKAAAREARRAAGIPTRSISVGATKSTKQQPTVEIDSDDETVESGNTQGTDPTPRIAAQLLVSPKVKRLETTQRLSTYSTKRKGHGS